jgi:hypothetical protein
VPAELPELSPVECRRRAEQAAARSQVGESVMWGLLALAGEVAEVRRELKKARR